MTFTDWCFSIALVLSSLEPCWRLQFTQVSFKIQLHVPHDFPSLKVGYNMFQWETTEWKQNASIRNLHSNSTNVELIELEPMSHFRLSLHWPLVNITQCITCKQISNHTLNSKIQSIFDFVTALPPSNGKTVILTVVDRFSKMKHFIPLPKLLSALETADLLVTHVSVRPKFDRLSASPWELHPVALQAIIPCPVQMGSLRELSRTWSLFSILCQLVILLCGVCIFPG